MAWDGISEYWERLHADAAGINGPAAAADGALGGGDFADFEPMSSLPRGGLGRVFADGYGSGPIVKVPSPPVVNPSRFAQFPDDAS